MRLTLSRAPLCEYSLQAAYFGKNAGFMPVVHTAGLLMIFGYTMEYSHLGKTRPCIVMITVLSQPFTVASFAVITIRFIE